MVHLHRLRTGWAVVVGPIPVGMLVLPFPHFVGSMIGITRSQDPAKDEPHDKTKRQDMLFTWHSRFCSILECVRPVVRGVWCRAVRAKVNATFFVRRMNALGTKLGVSNQRQGTLYQVIHSSCEIPL